jgi:hypothetical protein
MPDSDSQLFRLTAATSSPHHTVIVKLRHAVGQDLDNRRFTLSVQRVGVFAGDEFNHKVAVISPAIAKMEPLTHLSLSAISQDDQNVVCPTSGGTPVEAVGQSRLSLDEPGHDQ